MSENAEIRGRVTNSTDVLIRATNPDVNLEEPFYAINWFSTKTEWLYHFYNFLAVRSVLKIGGKPFFKGSVGETILDDKGSGRRDLLLIVRYPGGLQFKSLMQSTYFKVVSVFRILSVKRFTFGFTHKIESENTSKKSDDLHYAIHHFKTEQDSRDTIAIIKEQLPPSIAVKYSGKIIANLYSQAKGEEAEQIPNLMSGVVVFQAAKEEDLRAFFDSEDYIKILKESDHNFISLMNRIF